MYDFEIDQKNILPQHEHVLGTIVAVHERGPDFKRRPDQVVKFPAQFRMARRRGAVVRIYAELVENSAVLKFRTEGCILTRSVDHLRQQQARVPCHLGVTAPGQQQIFPCQRPRGRSGHDKEKILMVDVNYVRNGCPPQHRPQSLNRLCLANDA